MTPRKRPQRAAIYARQSVAEPEGIARQVEACRQLAESRDYEVAEVYVDDAVSGYRDRGEGTAFARLLADARVGAFDVLIVRKLDRLGRSLAALEALSLAKVKTVTTDGELDLTSASGRLIANVLTSVARAESETKAERRVFANADRRTKGVPTSGRVPYGYTWVPTKERAARGTTQAYELDGERAEDVKAIYDAFLAGVPLGSIARDLNAAGKRTVRTKRHPEGVPFTPTTLRRLLMSPYYAALLPLPAPGGGAYDQNAITRDTCEQGDWPAIVSVAEWEAACARLRHPERKTSPGPTRKWLLSGIAVCGGQGRRDDAAIEALALEQTGKTDAGALTAQERAAAAVAIADERCGQPVRAGGGEAGIHSYRCGSMAHFMRRGDPLDSFIERLVIARLSRDDAADLLIDRERPDADALTAELTRLDAVRRELGDDRDEGLIGRAEYVRRLRTIDTKLAEIRGKLEKGAIVEPLRDLVAAEDVRAAWDVLTLGRKRAVLEALVTIVLHSVGQGNRRNMPDAAMAQTVTVLWHA